jgi:hypothetical protein
MFFLRDVIAFLLVCGVIHVFSRLSHMIPSRKSGVSSLTKN